MSVEVFFQSFPEITDKIMLLKCLSQIKLLTNHGCHSFRCPEYGVWTKHCLCNKNACALSTSLKKKKKHLITKVLRHLKSFKNNSNND